MTTLARFASLSFLLLALGLTCLAALAADKVGTWQRWEHSLTSTVEYSNPCTEVTLRARFEGPNGARREALGFWDGEDQFVIRCAFPAPGEWRWSTTCSDESNSGLHHQSGVVQVKRSQGDSPLLEHGYLKVSEDGRLLVHDDGTPFLWLGDTCWAAPVHATKEEWTAYVANRAAKGYSVLQLSIAPDWALEHSRLGIAPFLSELPDITKPNPVFFQELDRKLAEANDRGLVVMMVGLMETPHRYPPPEQVAVLSRYVAARYSSFEVILSPSFDSGIHADITEAAAQAVREAAPDNLITMHEGTGVGPYFHSAEWLSFDMYQSGHNGGDAARQSARAIGMAAEVLALTPRKPLVNGEAIYEGDLGSAYDVRRTAWLSFLSGAVGYTAGINEVYSWEPDVMSRLDVPSSDMMALLGRLLRTLPWWTLEAAPERLLYQPEDRARLMAFTLTLDKSLGLAYLPNNEGIILDLSGCPETYATLWINPATGQRVDGAEIMSSARTTLTPPDRRDWLLVLARPDSEPLKRLKQGFKRGIESHEPVASIVFDGKTPTNGLVQKSPADGVWTPTSLSGVGCLVNENPARNSYLYFDVDDRLAFRDGVALMWVEVRLRSDAPLTGLQLQYDARGPAEVDTRYQPVAPASKTQDDDWTVVIFEAPTPYLGNRENSGADFRLFFNRELVHVASLEVRLEED